MTKFLNVPGKSNEKRYQDVQTKFELTNQNVAVSVALTLTNNLPLLNYTTSFFLPA